MSVETYRDRSHRGLRIRTEQERARAFLAAERHSRVVNILRLALPIMAVFVLAGYFISTSLSVRVGDVTASISGVQVGDGNLRMTNPTLKGVNKKSGAYVISAAYADQNVKTPKIVQLHAIKAKMTSAEGGWSRVNAIRGTFNSDSQQLVMKDDINIATSSGITGTMTLAYIDMKKQVLHSPKPVFFQTANGTVRSDQLTMLSGEHQIQFIGHVRVHLVHAKVDGGPGAASGAGEVQPPATKAATHPAASAASNAGAAQGPAGRLP